MTPDHVNRESQKKFRAQTAIPMTEAERDKIDRLIQECIREVGIQPRDRPVTYKNLFPFAKHKAIHEQDNLGYNSFKQAKKT